MNNRWNIRGFMLFFAVRQRSTFFTYRGMEWLKSSLTPAPLQILKSWTPDFSGVTN
jgi:hypothetical protein